MTRPELRECTGCGLFQVVPELGPDMRSDCLRCGTGLRRTRRDPLPRSLALTIAALVLLVVTWTTMLMRVSTAGIVHEADMAAGPLELVHHGLWPLALVVAFTTALAPLAQYLCTLYVLLGLRARKPFPHLGRVFLFARRMALWAMLDVLLLGVFVAYTKLGDLVQVEVGVAVAALGLLTVVGLWANTALEPDAVWDAIEARGQTHGAAIGTPLPAERPLEFHPGMASCEACGLVGRHDTTCLRCGSTVHARKPNSLHRTWALIAAAAILYIPANAYPVLTVIQAGAGAPSTIIDGIEELVASRMYPLAILVFVASVLVPVLKLMGLALMLMAIVLVTTAAGASRLLIERTRLYHVVAWIGRWSMVDIFMESLLGALVQFGSVVSIAPGTGAVAFCGVVILTILAAETFDPRVMWDAAQRNAHRPYELLGAQRRAAKPPSSA
ncbi:MAG: paraquat-inducible protein A [Enhydrobacter sp.]|nr:MAG: paraquat-inducible protein A [Enhydrobacter sp.]